MHACFIIVSVQYFRRVEKTFSEIFLSHGAFSPLQPPGAKFSSSVGRLYGAEMLSSSCADHLKPKECAQ
jgi:hypothetical protein